MLVAENSAGKQEVNILVKVYGKLMTMSDNDILIWPITWAILTFLKSDLYYSRTFILPVFLHVIQQL